MVHIWPSRIARFVAYLSLTISVTSELGAQAVFETQGDLVPQDCASSVRSAESSNGFQLFLGALACYDEGQQLDGTFLLLAGQERSMADMSIFEASGDDAEQAAAELYGFIYFRAGGLGPNELYRDEAKTQRLVDRLRSWKPLVEADYDPGWTYRENPRIEVYETFVADAKKYRIAQIARQATLLRNDEYYSLSMELAQIRSPNAAIQVGSEDYQAVQRLTARMAEIANQIAQPVPESKTSIEYEYRPDPNASFRQLFMGVNGPSQEGTSSYTSREDVTRSWVARALSEDQLISILDQVDFKDQVLVSFGLGELRRATGRIYISHLEIDSTMEVRRINVQVGVMELECDSQPATLYPFALAVVDRESASSRESTSRGRSNFGDGCPSVPSSTPSD